MIKIQNEDVIYISYEVVSVGKISELDRWVIKCLEIWPFGSSVPWAIKGISASEALCESMSVQR